MESAQLIQIVLSAVLFIGVWSMLRRVLQPFIANVEERQARTFGDEHDAVEMRQKTRLLDAEIEELLRQARHDGATVRDAKIAAAKAEAQRQLEAAEAWANAEVEKGEAEILKTKNQAMAEAPAEIEKLARLVVDRALMSGGAERVVH